MGELNGALIFESMAERSVVTWNVMIVGLGTHGYGLDAVMLFHRMDAERVAVDDLSVLGMLTACRHAGLVSEGLEIFHRMFFLFLTALVLIPV